MNGPSKKFIKKYWPVFAGFFVIQILLDVARTWSYYVTGKIKTFSLFLNLNNSLIDHVLWVVIWMSLVHYYLNLKSEEPRRKWGKLGLLLVGFSILQAFLHQFIYLFYYNGVKGTNTPFQEIFLANIWFFIPSVFLGILVALFLLSMIVGLDYYEQYQGENLRRSELELELTNAKLETIQAQLNPHFLFNSLNTISMMVRSKSDKKAVSMISSLSDLLRISLNMKSVHLIPLKEEIKVVSKYLEIEQERFSDRLKVLIEISSKTEDIGVPNLILQPILENAFKYGVSENLNDAFIHIRSYLEDRSLILKVSNIGSKLPENFDLNFNKGNGLANVENRLKHLFEDYYFNISNENTQMVTVTIAIPITQLENDSDDIS